MYSIMPRRYKEKIQDWFMLSGSGKSPKGFVNYSFALSLTIGFIVSIFTGPFFLAIWALVFLGLFGLFHGFILLAIDRRAKSVEKILPDALQLMAANIKSGFIPSRALLLSARKEFGALSEGIKTAGKEMITGKSLQDSLDEIPKSIKSSTLLTTVKLIKQGIRGGGQLVSLFEETANDIRRRESIKKEVRASILMYGIFIGFAGCIGAPVLYALSSYLVGAISQLGSVMEIPADVSSQVPMSFSVVTISPEFLLMFSIIAIIITTFFGGIIIGLIGSGKERAGIKYVPMLLVVSLVVFFITKAVIGNLFMVLIP